MKHHQVFATALLLLSSAMPMLAKAETGDLWRRPSCGCCEKWAARMKDAGLPLTIHDLPDADLTALRTSSGISSKFAGCHTAKIGAFVIEGHVPPEDVTRLMQSKAEDVIGLSVPGMPQGSPGMEQGAGSESYDVLLIKKDGSSEVYSHHTGSDQ